MHRISGFLFFGALAALATGAFAQDGVKGTTLRPTLADANVKGCKISKPGAYSVTAGALIEIDYSFPVVPTATPKKVEAKVTNSGAVAASPLGVRSIQTGLLGARTIAFYLDAKKAGEDTVTVKIDDAEYAYKITVKEAK